MAFLFLNFRIAIKWQHKPLSNARGQHFLAIPLRG
nr:MAG TPA: hypothetical protein [Caudoviricetes sp.]